MMKWREWMGLRLVAAILVLPGCTGTSSQSADREDGGITVIPPVPEGFRELPTTSTGFRSAKMEHRIGGTWAVSFDDGIIRVSPIPFNVTKMDPKWYPLEGGAGAVLCRGYTRGIETLLTFDGSSALREEQTRLFFESLELKEAVKYSLPGGGWGPENPGEYVPPSRRVMRERF